MQREIRRGVGYSKRNAKKIFTRVPLSNIDEMALSGKRKVGCGIETNFPWFSVPSKGTFEEVTGGE